MFLIVWTQAFQNFNCFFLRRLFYCNRLKTAFQSCIFFNIFPVFLQSRRPNQLNLSSGKRRFQNVRGIQSTLCPTGADNCVNLINKKKDSLLFPYFVNDISNTFFKFSTIFASCYHSGKIQNYHTFIFYSIRNHSCDNPLCKPLYNSCFSDSGFSCQAWIVLGSST